MVVKGNTPVGGKVMILIKRMGRNEEGSRGKRWSEQRGGRGEG